MPKRRCRRARIFGRGRMDADVCDVRPVVPYNYGRIVCMKKTLHIDEDLLREARSVSAARTDTEAVRLGLESLIRRAAYDRLRALRGSEPQARETPRRRERSSSSRHSAA
jgi:hypothetical protein